MVTRRFMMAIAVAMSLMAMPFAAQAQFGNILKKASKAIEKVNKTLDTSLSSTKSDAAAPLASKTQLQSNGVEVSNPLAEVFDVELVGLYGQSTSLNYGKCYVALNINMKANANSIAVGGGYGETAIAVDQDGNSCQMESPSNTATFNVVEGIPTKVVVNGRYNCFVDVKKSAKLMRVLKLYFYVDAKRRGCVIFKNVPVLWDQEPE